MKSILNFLLKSWYYLLPLLVLAVYLIKRFTSKSSTVLEVQPVQTTVQSEDKSIPVGVRNNNPMNIRATKTNWQGEVTTTNAFEKFENLVFGYRAAIVLLHTYFTKYGLNTIEKLVNRWAPPDDHNPTTAYVANVSKWTGIPKNQVIKFDFATISKLVIAMTRMETGLVPTSEQLSNAWQIRGFN